MRGAWGEKEKIIKIILFLSFEPTWGAPLGVVLPLGWRGSLGGYFSQVLVMILQSCGGRCDGPWVAFGSRGETDGLMLFVYSFLKTNGSTP